MISISPSTRSAKIVASVFGSSSNKQSMAYMLDLLTENVKMQLTDLYLEATIVEVKLEKA